MFLGKEGGGWKKLEEEERPEQGNAQAAANCYLHSILSPPLSYDHYLCVAAAADCASYARTCVSHSDGGEKGAYERGVGRQQRPFFLSLALRLRRRRRRGRTHYATLVRTYDDDNGQEYTRGLSPVVAVPAAEDGDGDDGVGGELLWAPDRGIFNIGAEQTGLLVPVDSWQKPLLPSSNHGGKGKRESSLLTKLKFVFCEKTVVELEPLLKCIITSLLQILLVLFVSIASCYAEADPSAVADADAFFFGGGNRCECRNYYTKKCQEAKEKQCETFYTDACKTVYKEHCEYEKKQQCQTSYKEECSYEQKQECATTYKEVCKPSYNYEKKCTKIPEEKCHYKTVPKCHKVPQQHCTDYTVPKCNKYPEQKCKKVPQKKCHYVSYYVPKKIRHRECQKEQKYYVTKYKTEYKEACQKIEVPKCKTTYKEECEYEQKQKCQTSYKKECSYEQKQECATTYKEVCKPSYNYEKKCTKIPEEKCHYKTVPKCHDVPQEHCQSYTVPKCHKVPQQYCKTTYKKECHKYPVEYPVKKQAYTCVWPEYRKYGDDDHC